MQCAPSRAVGDLLAAAEAIGENERRQRRILHLGKELAFSAGHRDLIVALLEAERAGHAAAPGVEHAAVEAELFEETLLGAGSGQGLLVAVHLDERRGRLA